MNRFILPEKWYVERTIENSDIVNKWACDLKGKYHAYRDTSCYFLNDGNYQSISNSGINSFIEKYTLITYQQFLDYVINQKPIIEDTTELNEILIKLLTE